jgi:hypothetical protein
MCDRDIRRFRLFTRIVLAREMHSRYYKDVQNLANNLQALSSQVIINGGFYSISIYEQHRTSIEIAISQLIVKTL